jgi:DNA-directed RNA polymerase specialized sigma24 family protein
LTREELERRQYLVLDVENIAERIARLRAEAENTVTSLSPNHGGGHPADSDKIGRYISTICDLETTLRQKKREIDDIDTWIYTLPQPARDVFIARFIRREPIRSISKSRNISRRTICRIIESAV